MNNTTVAGHFDDVVSGNKVLFSDFKELSINVKNIIARSAKKSCLLDPMPTSKIMQCADELLPVVTLMINLPLQSGFFAGQWKEALLHPMFKKSGLKFITLHPLATYHSFLS